ncbi:12410_t:CDS:10 [Entrophospora sp. SA101]|nr:12410_t:CDS:10 [Entrophospora sp. SA101]
MEERMEIEQEENSSDKFKSCVEMHDMLYFIETSLPKHNKCRIKDINNEVNIYELSLIKPKPYTSQNIGKLSLPNKFIALKKKPLSKLESLSNALEIEEEFKSSPSKQIIKWSSEIEISPNEMFWRFGLNHSAIDGLLDKEDLTLEELLDVEDLLQECKAHNSKLIEYLRNPSILSQLLGYIIREDLEDRQKYKYPYIACEILSCEIWPIYEAIIENMDLLVSFWQLLDRPPPLNPLQSSYFSKVNTVLLQKKMNEMVKFIQSIPNVNQKFLTHMETSTITDLLLKLISVDEYPEGAGVIDWLDSEGLIEALVSKLDPYLDSDTVTRIIDYMLDPEAPNSTSTLTNGVSIFIQIIQKNNSDYNEEAMLSLSPHQSHPVVDLSDMLRVLANRIGEFKALLLNPKSVTSQIDTTIGKMVPLGFERFRICELFAELLHCSNMSSLNVVRYDSSSNGFYELKHTEDYNDYGQPSEVDASEHFQTTDIEPQTSKDIQLDQSSNSATATSPIPMETEPIKPPPGLELVSQPNRSSSPSPPELPVGDLLKLKFIEHKIIPTCLDLFFNFKWNNFLHTVVYDMIAQIFNGRMDIGYNKDLAISVFVDGEITKRVTKAQRLNDYERTTKRSKVRLYGSFNCYSRRDCEINGSICSRDWRKTEDWQEYVSKTLRETRERDRAPLGGQRPTNHDSMSPSREGSEDDEDEDDAIEAVADGDMADDQFARYLCQQITNDLPDKFGSSDESDEEDEPWMNEDFDKDTDFEMQTPPANMIEEAIGICW